MFSEEKGWGVHAGKKIARNDFVLEYKGDLLDNKSAKERESEYAKDESIGCFMYFFKYKEKRYCIDATRKTPYMGRLINHSRLNNNLYTKVIPINDTPRLIFFASKDIEPGSELLYDYSQLPVELDLRNVRPSVRTKVSPFWTIFGS